MKKSKSLFNPFSFRRIQSTRGNHSFANSFSKLQYAKLLRIEDYEKLVDQETAEDVLKVLSENHEYSISSVLSVKEVLLQERKKTIDFLINSVGNRAYGAPKSSLIQDFFLLPLDFFNLKVLSKGQLENRDWDRMPFSTPGYLSLDRLQVLYQRVPLGFLHPFLKLALRNFQRLTENQKTPYFLDVFWDNQLHEVYQNILTSLRSEILSTLYKTKLDIKNILAVLRLKNAGKSEDAISETIQHLGNIRRDVLLALFHTEFENAAELFSQSLYGKEISVGMETFKETKDFSSLEKHLEEFWLRSCHRFVALSYDEDLAIIYDWLQQNEHSNIQTVISGKQNKMNSPWILSHLRTVL